MGLWRQLDKQFRLGCSVTLKLSCLDVSRVGFLSAVQELVAVEVMAGIFVPPPPEENLSLQFEGFFARKLFWTGSITVSSLELSF